MVTILLLTFIIAGEAVGAVYRMQSKWMDATIHISNYHLQSSQYDKIKPPSYSKHHDLNANRLTRDRERLRFSHTNLGTTGKMSIRRSHQRSIEAITIKGERTKMVGMIPSVQSGEDGAIPVIETQKRKPLRISTRRFEFATSSFGSDLSNDNKDFSKNDDENVPEHRAPQFLSGRPRTDGNWGKLFEDGKSTFMDPQHLSKIDHNGFASIQGGRTPILFLQELAHLASLLNAVALSTLRNDVEGVSSPLSLYMPGSPWPPVDPKLDHNLYDSKLEGSYYAVLYFLGQGYSPEERANYNVARPLPVLGGGSDAEIQMLQIARGPLAKTQLCFGWLSEFSVREYDEGAHGALLSRCMQFLSDGMLSYNDSRKIMFNPFPL